MFMAVRVICFYQPGCMGCMEQTPINLEVAKALNIPIEEIDAIKNQDYIREFGLKVTPTILILRTRPFLNGSRGSFTRSSSKRQ